MITSLRGWVVGSFAVDWLSGSDSNAHRRDQSAVSYR